MFRKKKVNLPGSFSIEFFFSHDIWDEQLNIWQEQCQVQHGFAMFYNLWTYWCSKYIKEGLWNPCLVELRRKPLNKCFLTYAIFMKFENFSAKQLTEQKPKVTYFRKIIGLLSQKESFHKVIFWIKRKFESGQCSNISISVLMLVTLVEKKVLKSISTVYDNVLWLMKFQVNISSSSLCYVSQINYTRIFTIYSMHGQMCESIPT